jgi:hypothetical protein
MLHTTLSGAEVIEPMRLIRAPQRAFAPLHANLRPILCEVTHPFCRQLAILAPSVALSTRSRLSPPGNSTPHIPPNPSRSTPSTGSARFSFRSSRRSTNSGNTTALPPSVVHVASRHPQSMKMTQDWLCLMPPARNEDRTTLERAEPAHQSGLDVVSNPKLLPRLTRARRADCFTFRCPSAQE